jgi:hypothetical protein
MSQLDYLRHYIQEVILSNSTRIKNVPLYSVFQSFIMQSMACVDFLTDNLNLSKFQSIDDLLFGLNREATSIWAQIPGSERILPTQNAVGAETRGLKY